MGLKDFLLNNQYTQPIIYFSKNPADIKKLPEYNNLSNQYDNDVGAFLRANTNNDKLYSNDIRHQYVSAKFTQNQNPGLAKALGNLNELTDFNMSGRDDTETDQANNYIGRVYAQKYPDIEGGKLLKLLFSDYDKNKAIRNDYRQNQGH